MVRRYGLDWDLMLKTVLRSYVDWLKLIERVLGLAVRDWGLDRRLHHWGHILHYLAASLIQVGRGIDAATVDL